jgi:hypothetical protein
MNPKSLHAIARHRSVFAISRNRLSFKMRPTCRSRSRHARSRETHPIVPTHHLGTLDHPVGFNTSGALVCSRSAASRARNNSFFIVCGIVPTIHLTTTGSIVNNVGLAGRIAAGTEEPNRRPNETLKNTHTSCDGTGRHDCDGARLRGTVLRLGSVAFTIQAGPGLSSSVSRYAESCTIYGIS